MIRLILGSLLIVIALVILPLLWRDLLPSIVWIAFSLLIVLGIMLSLAAFAEMRENTKVRAEARAFDDED